TAHRKCPIGDGRPTANVRLVTDGCNRLNRLPLAQSCYSNLFRPKLTVARLGMHSAPSARLLPFASGPGRTTLYSRQQPLTPLYKSALRFGEIRIAEIWKKIACCFRLCEGYGRIPNRSGPIDSLWPFLRLSGTCRAS